MWVASWSDCNFEGSPIATGNCGRSPSTYLGHASWEDASMNATSVRFPFECYITKADARVRSAGPPQ